MKKILIVFFGGILLFSCKPGPEMQTAYQVYSPDNRVSAGFYLDLEGNLAYTVSLNHAQLIFPSRLALEPAEGGIIGENMELVKVESSEIDETYPVYAGKSSTARNHCNQMVFSLREKSGQKREMKLVFRAYNDGVAFRYEIPEQPAIENYDLASEHTQFLLCRSATIWPLLVPDMSSHYEYHFPEMIPDSITEGMVVGLPLSFKIHNQLSGCITEASLDNFPGMYLTKDPNEPLAFRAKLSPHPADSSLCFRSENGFTTPWRVVMVSGRLADLIPSDLVMNLNAPCKIEDPSWIKPGKVAWDWWSGPVVEKEDITAGMNMETMKYYIDFADEFDLEYMLIDAGWYGDHRDTDADVTTSIPGMDIPELVKYAGDRGVGILLWLNWIPLSKKMEETYALYESWGVKGVKIDYMNRDDQEMVRFYQEATELAARHHLLVDFHGAYKPDGIRRTWPNLMTREGILGLEHLKWSDRADPVHNVTIPFTRMLAGPMDYTPGGFRQVRREDFKPMYTNPLVLGTRCHQLAMYVVYESPLQMLSDHPDAYRGEPGSEFLKEVPASWDETVAVSGERGEYVILARRKGNTWYLGGMNGKEEREAEFRTEFLEPGTRYQMSLYTDTDEADLHPVRLNMEERSIDSQSVMSFVMAQGGGFVAVLKPAG